MEWNGIVLPEGSFVVEVGSLAGMRYAPVGIDPTLVRDLTHPTDRRYNVLVAEQFFAVKVVYPDGDRIVPAKHVGPRGLEDHSVPMPHFTRGVRNWGWCTMRDLVHIVGARNPALTWGGGPIQCVFGSAPQGVLRHCTVAGLALLPPDTLWVPAGWAQGVCILASFESR